MHDDQGKPVMQITNLLRRGSAVRYMEETSPGRLDIVLENRDRQTTSIRLWRGEGVANLPDPEWMVRNFVQKGGLTVVYGPPGTGKSLFMLDMAQMIQSGAPFLGRYPTKPANTMYVMAEGQFGLRGRLEAWKIHNEVEDLPPVNYHIEGVSFWTPNGKDNPGASAIVMAAAALDVEVVFIDTLAATFGGGDENRQQDMNLWLVPLRELRQHGISVVVAHHANRSEGKMRGSSVIGGEADTIIELRPSYNKANPGIVDSVKVVNQKQKDFVPFVPFRMAIDSIQLPETIEGYERSGPVMVMAEDRFREAESAAKELASSNLRQRMITDMMMRVGEYSGLTWEELRAMVPGKNTLLAEVRDWLIEHGYMEYNEAKGGYRLGKNEFPLPETPPLLGE